MVDAPRPADRTGERILFTPGPLTTSATVRGAMGIDIGSWDIDCIDVVADIRQGLLSLAGGADDLTCVLFQGSGSFGVEAALGSAIPRDGKLLVLVNGAYGQRICSMATTLGIQHSIARDPEDRPHDPERLEAALREDPEITHVACVHCETTTGILNPLRELGLAVERQGRSLIVDAISTFGGYPCGPGEAIDFNAGPIDHLIGSTNKCIEGVPGFNFILSRAGAMERCRGQARSLCLDMYDQWRVLEDSGKFRYTPPTHVLLAFRQALLELEQEGGVAARAARYANNHRVLTQGMSALGYRCFVPTEWQSHIITSFCHPDAGFDFKGLYDRLHAAGFIIYPGKVTETETFRIGTIGAIDSRHIELLLEAIAG